MNDRYLFRGKRLDNGEWVVGYRVHEDIIRNYNSGCRIQHDIDQETTSMSIDCDFECRAVRVDPATVGQCTELKDKNGELIFEGDVVKGIGCAGETLIEPVLYCKGEYLPFDYIGACDVEIIGNIYDDDVLELGGGI